MDYTTDLGDDGYGNFNLFETDRFVEITENEVFSFIEQQENANTKKKTLNNMKVFQDFLTVIGEINPPHLLSPDSLAKVISRFLLSVRKKDGSEYEPSSLRGFYSSIDRNLRQNNFQLSIISDPQFSICREALKSKQKQLKSLGKGNKPNAAEELTDENIDQLYINGQLGFHSPHALINSLWLNNMLYFGMRGGVEQHNLKWGDVAVERESDGRQYLIYTQERQTKTRTGENPRNIRAVKPRAYENPDQPERDPVKAYMEYSSRRPDSMMGPDDAFFLSVNEAKSSLTDRAWFKKQNMGINKIYSLMRSMKAKANLPATKRLTNHSARKHLLQKLNDSNIPPNQIIQISGHKNINSVNNYCSINSKQQANISSILANTSKSTSIVPVSTTVTTSAVGFSDHLMPPASPVQHASQSLCSSQTQYSHADTRAIFQGSTFNNCVVHVYCDPNADRHHAEPPNKFRRILPISDSDSE